MRAANHLALSPKHPSHIRLDRWILAGILVAAPLGCGSPENPDTGGAADSGVADAGSQPGADAGVDREDAGTGIILSLADAGPADAGGATACGVYTPVQLTVMNYLSWCSVSVNGGTPSTAPVTTTCVGTGTTTLDATALSGFVLGDWFGTSGDTGSGDPGTVTGTGASAQSQATVSASGDSACVSVCCPGVNGSAPCPTTNQCATPGPSGY
jgi:hypothetical protein